MPYTRFDRLCGYALQLLVARQNAIARGDKKWLKEIEEKEREICEYFAFAKAVKKRRRKVLSEGVLQRAG